MPRQSKQAAKPQEADTRYVECTPERFDAGRRFALTVYAKATAGLALAAAGAAASHRLSGDVPAAAALPVAVGAVGAYFARAAATGRLLTAANDADNPYPAGLLLGLFASGYAVAPVVRGGAAALGGFGAGEAAVKGCAVVAAATVVGHAAACAAGRDALAIVLGATPLSLAGAAVALRVWLSEEARVRHLEKLLLAQTMVGYVLTAHTWWCLEEGSTESFDSSTHALGVVGAVGYSSWAAVRFVLRCVTVPVQLVFPEKMKRYAARAVDVVSAAGLYAILRSKVPAA